MSWIKDNKFVASLAGGTLLAVVLLWMVGSSAASRHAKAKEDFDSAAAEATTFEKLPLYPDRDNLNGKNKALDEYRKSVSALQTSFAPFRPEKIENITTQAFANQLKTVNEEVINALKESGCKVPEGFFCGFEPYKSNMAPETATGVMHYQLAGIKNMMLALAASGAKSLNNLHRPSLPEEGGEKTWQPQPNEVARPFPLEITFTGPEKSVREFLSFLSAPAGQYVVIRSLRISNAKKEPPRAQDAKFEKAAAKPPATVNEIFGAETSPAAGAAPASQPAARPSKILAQVLGNEEVQVFIRLEHMMFLPAKPLP